MNLQNLAQKFLDEKSNYLKQKSFICYCQLLNNHILPELERFDFQYSGKSFFENLAFNGSNSTQKLKKLVFNAFLKFAYQKGYLKEEQKIKAKIPNQHKNSPRVLTEQEAKVLEDYIIKKRNFYNYGVLLTLRLGLRIGELLALRWEDVDFENQTISINKTSFDLSQDQKLVHATNSPKSESSNRLVPITQSTKQLLKELKSIQPKSDFVVCNHKGGQVFTRAYQKSFENLLKKLKIKHYPFHSLRHTFATRCYNAGIDIKTLSEILGHSSINITLDIYVHSSIKTKQNALSNVEKKLKFQNKKTHQFYDENKKQHNMTNFAKLYT